MPLPACRCRRPFPKAQPPELLPEERLGRLPVVRTMKLGSYGVSAEPFRSASAGGVVVPLLPVMSPAHQG